MRLRRTRNEDGAVVVRQPMRLQSKCVCGTTATAVVARHVFVSVLNVSTSTCLSSPRRNTSRETVATSAKPAISTCEPRTRKAAKSAFARACRRRARPPPA